jgi:DNA modification methylase
MVGSMGRQNIREVLGREPVHPFPARMAPGIALKALSQHETPLRVLDPMMGSGTVIAVARSKGHKCVGVDIDPLAVLMTQVWTSVVDRKSLCKQGAIVLGRAERQARITPLRNAYPDGCDPETKRFIRYWFDGESRRQLSALSKVIGEIKDSKIKAALWCAFSRLIITKSSGASLAMDLSHSRPHKVYSKAPHLPFTRFIAAVGRVADSCIPPQSKNRGPIARIAQGDARKLPVKANSIDLVLTSPPYLNAIDYLRCSKFTLVWMGYNVDQLTALRSGSVGTEVGKKIDPSSEYVLAIVKKLRIGRTMSQRHKAILYRFIDDMQQSLLEVARVLSPGGRAVYVIGENTIRGTYVRNATIIIEIAKRAGLHLQRRSARMLPENRRYMPPPNVGRKKGGMNVRMRREVIIELRKPSISELSFLTRK